MTSPASPAGESGASASPSKLWLPALFLTALSLRVLYVWEWSDWFAFKVQVGDALSYDTWARRIAAGEWMGHEVFYQAPLYPYFLGVLYHFVGDDPWVLRIAQILLGSAACVLLALAGRGFFGLRVGLCAGALLAFYAPAIYFDGLVQKTSLSVFFLTLWLWGMGEFRATRRVRWLWLSGLALGGLALLRENTLILVPVALAWLALGAAAGDEATSAVARARHVGAFALGLVLVLVPVGLRNQWVGGEFLVTTSQLGSNLYIGNHPGANGGYSPLLPGRGDASFERRDAVTLAERDLGRQLRPGEISRYWVRRTAEYVRSQPGDWLRLLATKLRLVWHADEMMDTEAIEAYQDRSHLLRVLGVVFHFGTLLPLAVVGAVATASRWRKLWLLYAAMTALAASLVLFYVLARYRQSLAPLVALFAAAGAVELARRVRQRDWRRIGGLAALLFAVALAVNWPRANVVYPRALTHHMLGLRLAELGRYDEAVAEVGRAIDLAPDHPYPYLGMGAVLRRMGDVEGMVRYYARGLELGPNLDEYYGYLAGGLLLLGRSEEAMRVYERALSMRPDDEALRRGLAAARAAARRANRLSRESEP